AESTPPWIHHILRAVLVVAVFSATTFLVEAMVVADDLRDVPLWMSVLNIGAGAPLALVSMCILGLLMVAWARVPGLAPAGLSVIPARVWDWLRHGDPQVLAWRAAWTLAVALLVPVWLLMVVRAGNIVDTTIAT